MNLSCLLKAKVTTRATRFLAGMGRLLCAIIAIAVPTQMAKGQSGVAYYWDGATGSTSWNSAAGTVTNWSSSPLTTQGTTVPPTGSNIFFYQSSTGLTNTLGADFSIGSLTFLSSSTQAVTIGGANTLTITGFQGNGIVLQAGSASDILNTNIAIGASQTWQNQSVTSGTSLTFGGIISGSASNALTLSGAATSNFAGAPANGGFVFQNANTYAGATTLSTLGTSLTLNGGGSILSTASITLGGGTVLTLDNTTNSLGTRIASAQTINANGASFALIGNSAGTSQTVGTLALGSGQSYVNVSGGAGTVLTFGSGSIPSFSPPTAGGVGLNFSIASGTNVAAPNVTLIGAGANAIIGGYATIGNINSNANGNTLDFATVSGGNVVPLSTITNGYNTSTTTSTWTGTNIKQNSTVAASGTLNVNSAYFTGAALVGTASTATTLTVGSGGIISNGATGSYVLNGNYTVTNAAELGASAFSAAALNYNANFTITSSTKDLVVTTASNLQINAAITGNIGLTKNGSGILDLATGNNNQGSIKGDSNTYTGTTTVNGGILLVANDPNFGTPPSSFTANNIILNGGEIQTTAGFSFNSNRGITLGNGGGILSYIGGSTFNVVQPIAGTGGLTIWSNPLGTASNSETSVLNNTSSKPNTFTGALTLQVSQSTGENTTGGGIVSFGSSNQIPITGGVSSALTLQTVFGSGATAGQPVPGAYGAFALPGTGVGVINWNGTTQTAGSLSGNAPVTNFNTGTLTIGNNNLNATWSGSLSGTITNAANGNWTVTNAGTGSVTKVGSGIQIFSGVNNYTGATSVQGGTLLIGSGTATTSTASLTGTSAVTVSGGATLGGNGTIAGAVTINTGGFLAPAMSSSTTSTLTVGGNLTIANGSNLSYNLAAPGTNDLVKTTGAATLTLNGTTDTLNLNELSGFTTGSYTLLTSVGVLTDNVPNNGWTINGSSAFNYAITHTNGAGGSVVLTVTPGSPTATWLGTGSTPNSWDLGVTNSKNWLIGGVASVWGNGNGTGDNAVFDDTGSTTPNVLVNSAGVNANTLLINAATTNYDISTASGGSITVAGAITKNNSANFTFDNAGGGSISVSAASTTINGGALIIGSGATLTSPTVTVQGGTLTVNGTGNVIASSTAGVIISSGSLTGTGTITGNVSLSGSGAINLTGAGNITGAMAVTGGSWNGQGTVGGQVTVSSGTLNIASGANLTATVGVLITGGSISAGSSTSTVTASVSVMGGGGAFGAVIAGPSSSLTLLAGNTGTLTLANINTYGGGTTIQGGILQLGISNALPTATALVLPTATPGSAFDLNNFNQTIASLTGGDATGGNVTTGNGVGGTLTLNGNVAGAYNGSISGNGSLTLSASATGTLQLGGINTYSGATTVNGGVLQAGIASAFSPNSGVVLGASGTLDLNNLPQQIASLSGSGSVIDTGGTGAGALTISGTATTTFSGSLAMAGGLTLGSTNTGSLTLSNPVGNTYGSAATVTAISGGTLLVTNTSGSATGSGTVTVAAGATLGGSGLIVPNTGTTAGNTVNIAGVIAPSATPGGANTLTIGSAANNATVTVTGTENFFVTAFGASGVTLGVSTPGSTQSLLTVLGSLTLTGSTVNVNTTLAAPSQPYSWEIATASTLTGMPSTISVAGGFAGYASSFTLTEQGDNLYLNYTPPYIWAGNSNPSAAWNVGTNWLSGSVPGAGNIANFINTVTSTTVTLGGVFNIGTIRFDTPNVSAHTLGSAPHTGDAFLFDSGGGVTVTSAVTNLQTFNADLQSQGPLNISNSGSGGLTFNGNLTSPGGAGLLTFSGANPASVTTYNGNITSGAVGLTQAGAGAVILAGTNTYTGLTMVNSGALTISGNEAGVAGGITVSPGATLNVNNNNALGTGVLTLSSGAILGSTAASPITAGLASGITMNSFVFNGVATPLAFSSPVTMGGDVVVTINGAGSLTFSGTVSGAPNSIGAAGGGTGSVNFTNPTLAFVNVTNTGAGTLSLGGNLNVTGSVTNSSTGSISLSGTTTTITGAIVAGGGSYTQLPATPAGLAPFSFSVAGGNVIIGAGATVTATGLSIGGVATSGQLSLGANSSLTVTQGSTVYIGNNFALQTANTGAIINGAVGSSLKINVTSGNLLIGGGNVTNGDYNQTQVNLGSGTNTFQTAAGGIIWIADNPGNNGQDGNTTAHGTAPTTQLGQNTVNFGAGVNNVYTDTFNISGSKTPGTAYLANPGVLGNFNLPTSESPVIGAVLNILGNSSTNATKANLNIGDNAIAGATNNSSIGVLDTTGGVLNATLGVVTLGIMPFNSNNPLAGGSGSWVLGTGYGTSASTNNSVTLDTLNLTNSASTATFGNINGVFSLNGGIVKFNTGTGTGILVEGAGTAPTSSIVNLNGGTLNMNGTSIGAAAAISFLNMTGGTLQNAATVNVTGGFTQTGGMILVDTTSQTGLAMTTTLNTGYTVAGGAILQLNAGGGGTVTLTTPTLTRSTTGSVLPAVGSYVAGAGFSGFGGLAAGTMVGTLDIIPVTTSLGTNELLTITGTLPTTTNGIIAPWVVARNPSAGTADFTTLSGNNVVSFAGYATYGAGGLNNASGAGTDVANPSQATILSSSPTVYALKLQNAVTDSGTNSLTINGTAGGQGGLILDGGSIQINGQLLFGAGTGEATIYTTAHGGTIAAAIAASSLTTFGPGVLTLNNDNTTTIAGVVNVNGGTLNINNSSTGSATGSGAVNINNGATLTGTGRISSGANNVTFGPGAIFASGNFGGAGITNIVTTSGNVVTASPKTNPGSLTAANLAYGNGISPTNVVGSVFSYTLSGSPATAAVNTGLSNNLTLGTLVGGLSFTSSSGTFTLNPITTVTVSSNTASLGNGSYSFLVGTVPAGSAGSVTNPGNFTFIGSSFASQLVTNVSLTVQGNNLDLNFQVSPTPEPEHILLLCVGALLAGFVIRRRWQRGTSAASIA